MALIGYLEMIQMKVRGDAGVGDAEVYEWSG